MKSAPEIVGVRELRARLSAYLRAVARGATVTVGDRRRQPVARLVPAKRSVEEEHLSRLADRGVVQRGTGKPGHPRPLKPHVARRTVADLVIEDRR